jgi:hypothetical protein
MPEIIDDETGAGSVIMPLEPRNATHHIAQDSLNLLHYGQAIGVDDERRVNDHQLCARSQMPDQSKDNRPRKPSRLANRNNLQNISNKVRALNPRVPMFIVS